MLYCQRGDLLPKIRTANCSGELKELSLSCIDRGVSKNSPVVNGTVGYSSLQALPGSRSKALD